MTEFCRPLVDDDGTVVAVVHGLQLLSDEGRAAMLDVVAAAQRLHDADPEREAKDARYAAAMERIRQRNARLRGGQPGV